MQRADSVLASCQDKREHIRNLRINLNVFSSVYSHLKACIFYGSLDHIFGDIRLIKISGSHGIAFRTTHAHEDKQTAGLRECSHVANRALETLVVRCRRFQAVAGKNDVEGFSVFLGQDSGFQDVAGNHLADGGPCTLLYF